MNKRYSFVVLSVLASLSVIAGLAMAKATFTLVKGNEYPVGLLAPGEVKCHGGNPTGNPFMPCPAGVSGTVRGQVRKAQEVTTDDRLSGVNTVVLNMNIHADGSANIWGTFRIEVANGAWEGVWEGKNTANGLSTYSATGHGSGSVEGLQLLWDGTYQPGASSADITARILSPGK